MSQIDPHFQSLDNLRTASKDSASTISQHLFEWKVIFSLKWYCHYYEKPHNSLREVWLILFTFGEFPDANVNVASFNAIGAFLLALAPFHSSLLITTFGEILGQLPVSPNTSAIVISSYVFLSHQIGRHKLPAFIDGIPILHHFSSDLRSFVHHIPNLINRMSELEVDFHKALVRSLICSFGRQPNLDFVDSVMASLAHFPSAIFSVLTEFIETNDLRLAQLAFGGPLLRSPELSLFLTHENKLSLFELAETYLTDDGSAVELEQAVAIISCLITESDESIRTMALNLTRRIQFGSLPEHIMRLLIPLVPSFEDLRMPEGASSADLCSRLAAMANFSPEHDSEIFEICMVYLDRRDQVFVTVVELFIAKPSILKSGRSIMHKILIARDLSWIQLNAVVKLVGILNQFEFQRDCRGYVRMVLDLIIPAALSPQAILAQTARTSLSQFVGTPNVEMIVSRLMKIDWFNPKIIESVILLLLVIVDQFNFPCFRPLVPLISEALLAFPDQSFVPDGFRFLCRYPSKHLTSALSELCFIRIQQHYWSFTQCRLLPSHPVDFEALGPIFAQTTTDVIACDLSVNTILSSIQYCFDYFSAHPMNNFGLITRTLLLLCPQTALRISKKRRVEIHAADVEELIGHTKSPSVLARCIDYFTPNPPESVIAIVNDIVRLRLAVTGKLAFIIVRFVAARDKEVGLQIAAQLLRDLPEDQQPILAIKLYGFEPLGLRETLITQFPFLGINGAPEKTRLWFQTNPVSKWPLTADPEFTKEVFAFLSKSSEKFKLDDLENIEMAVWTLIMRYRELFKIQPLKRVLSDVTSMDKLKRIASPAKGKVFQGINPVQGVSLGSTVAPQLRRGVIIDSLRLLVSFFNHSSVVISQKLFDEIREKYPNLNENSRKYAVRCGLRFVESEESVNIESLISTFSMKSKFLSRLCQTVVNGPQIEILRMLMFQQISSLKNDKRWFYFLRFMRITLVLDEKKTEGYRRNTREWFKDILTGFTVESDVVLGELCRLLQSVFSADVIRQKADQHQQFGSVMYRSFQESDYFTEIPSLILDIIAHHTQYPKTDVVRLLDERKSLILSNHLLAEIVISFFKENPTFLAKPDGWFAGLLDPLSGLFVTASDSITQLFSQFPSAVGNHESAMTLIRVSGYSASCSIPISSSYYRARVKSSPGDSAQRLEMQELLQLTELFLVNPNASSCHAIVGKLVEASKFFDCVSFLLGRLIGISGHFGWVVIVASRYLAAVSESQRAQLITRVSESQKLKPKSRGLAMKRVTEQKKEEAFALALAETDDESVIDRNFCPQNETSLKQATTPDDDPPSKGLRESQGLTNDLSRLLARLLEVDAQKMKTEGAIS